MRIKLGDFGGRVAPTVPSNLRSPGNPGVEIPAGAFVSTSTEAGERIVQAASDLVKQERAKLEAEAQEQKRLAEQAERQRKTDEEQAGRNRAAASFAHYQADVNEAAFQIGTRLQEGQVSREDAQKELEKAFADLRMRHVDPIDQSNRAALENNLVRFDRAAALSLARATNEHAKRERAGNFQLMLDGLERLAVVEPEKAILQAERAFLSEGVALFGGDNAVKQALATRERFKATHYVARLNDARGTVNGLAAVREQIAGDADLDPDKKNILLARTDGQIETLNARAERARQSRLRSVDRAITDGWNTTLKGFDLAPEQLDAFAKAAKGTELEGDARSLLELNRLTSQFRSMAPAGRERYLNEMEAKVRTAPGRVDVQVLEHLRTMHQNLDQAAKADPISFAQQKRLAEVQPIDVMKLDTLGDQLTARMEIARGMRATYGTPIRVLTKGEAEQLSQAMNGASVEQKTTFLAAIRKAVPDQQAYTSLLSQMAQDSPVTAVAGVVAARDRWVTVQRRVFGANVEQSPREVASLILEGEGAINRSKDAKAQDGRPASRGLFVPPEDKLKAAFAQATGGAFASDPGGADLAFQGVRAYYVGASIREGDVFDKDKGVNTDRLQRSLRAVVGEVHDFQGRGTVLLPWGMDSATFQDRVRKRYGEAVRAAGLPEGYVNMLPGMGLQQLGDGRYLVKSGTSYLLGKNGRPVEIDVGDQYMLDAKGRRIIDQVPQ